MVSSQTSCVPAERLGTRGPGLSEQYLGFTLVELLVAVAIVSILAVMAYPTYRSQIERTRRADAEAVLMQAAQLMERTYTEFGCYNPGPDNDCTTAGDAAAPTLCPLNESPIDSPRNGSCVSTTSFYNIGIKRDTLSATAYTLEALGAHAESGAGNLEIDNTGLRRRDFNKNGTVAADELGW